MKSEKATAFLIWMIPLFSVVRLTTISEQSEPRFCFSVAYILQSPVHIVFVLTYTQFLPKLSDFLLHLVIREFVSVGIADFANTKSMGKSQFLNVHYNTTYGDQIWMIPLLSKISPLKI